MDIQISYNGKMPVTHSGVSENFIRIARARAKRMNLDVVITVINSRKS